MGWLWNGFKVSSSGSARGVGRVFTNERFFEDGTALKTDMKNYKEWLEAAQGYLTDDPLWKFETYRKACFVNDLAWIDCESMLEDSRGKSIVYQLTRSIGSISANIEEGYGRGFGKDYARFLRIALGSARESKGWYHRSRYLLDESVVEHRIGLIEEIIIGLVLTSQKQASLGMKKPATRPSHTRKK